MLTPADRAGVSPDGSFVNRASEWLRVRVRKVRVRKVNPEA
jgi:hypothetical protein